MNETRSSKRRQELTTDEDFYRIAKGVQNRSGQKTCSDLTEDRRFREYFGVSVHVAVIAWSLLVEHKKLPSQEEGGGDIEHLLWTMYFLFCYPKTQQGCSAAGGTDERGTGAVDPKTWRKYIWLMIYALADLESEVVSAGFSFCSVLVSFPNTFGLDHIRRQEGPQGP